MKLNSIRNCISGYVLPSLPEGISSPLVFAELLLHYYEFHLAVLEEGILSALPLTEKGIRELINLAFYASMAPEEGRFPRFKIASMNDAPSSPRLTRFDPIPLRDVDILRRLAPACTHPECALLVVEENGVLKAHGVVIVGPMGHNTMPGRPEFISVSEPTTFRVEIMDPGHITAGIGTISYELRAGKIRQLSPYWMIPSVRDFRKQVSQCLEQELLQLEGEDAKNFFGGTRYSTPIHVILSRMLRMAVEARHGGAFVIIPDDSSNSAHYSIQLKYKTQDVDLGLEMVNFWQACAAANRKYLKDGYQEAIQLANISKVRMLTKAEAVGNLSCVDGCVVLNRRLQLCGFGGEILASEEQVQNNPKRFKNIATDEYWDDEIFFKEIGGMRHKSAARLCKAYSNVLVFIVSQDGELKVFSSDADNAYAFGPLDLPFGDTLYP